MRTEKGKLIVVWVPGNHGAGGSTIADSLAVGMQYFYMRKALLINFSSKYSYMERFFENDASIRYSMDYLKGFGNAIDKEQIFTFSTQLNNEFYIIPGTYLQSKLYDKAAEKQLLDKCLENFDIVIADAETGIKENNRWLLERADIIVAVMTLNEIMLDDIFNELEKRDIAAIIQDDRTIPIFNMIYDENAINKIIKRLSNKYKLDLSVGVVFDQKLYEACCRDKKIYSYMVEGFNRSSKLYHKQIEELTKIISGKLDIQSYLKINHKRSLVQRLFGQVMIRDEKLSIGS